jgi:hypothetical protein
MRFSGDSNIGNSEDRAKKNARVPTGKVKLRRKALVNPQK